MANKNKNIEELVSIDDDVTSELETLTVRLPMGGQGGQKADSTAEADANTFDFSDLEEHTNDGVAVSDLRDDLKVRSKTIERLQYDIEQLHAKWTGLEAEIKAREELTSKISAELKSTQNELGRKEKLLRKRDQSIKAMKLDASDRDKKFRLLQEISDQRQLTIQELKDGDEINVARQQLTAKSGQLASAEVKFSELRAQQQRTESYADGLRQQLADLAADSKNAFVERDTLNLALTEADSRLTEFEAELQTAKATHSATNKAFDAAKQAHEQEIRIVRFELGEATDTLTSRQQLNEELSTDLERARVSRDELETELNSREAASRAQFEALEKDSSARYEQLEQDSRAQLEALEKDSNARYEQLEQDSRTQLEALEKDSNARYGQLEQDSRAQLETLESESNARYEQLEQDSRAQLETLESESNARYEQLEQDSRTQLEALEKDSSARYEQLEQDSRTQLEALEKDSNARYGQLEQDSRAQLEALESESNARYEQLEQDSRAQLETLESESNARYEQLQQESRAQLETLEKEIADSRTQLETLEKEGNARYEQLEQDSRSELESLEEKRRSQLDELDKESSSRIEDLETQLQRLQQEITDYEAKIETKNDAISNLLIEVAKKTQEIDSIGEMKEVISDIDDRMSERIDEPAEDDLPASERERVTRLLIGRIDNQELRFPLFKDRLTIGRTQQNDIQLKAQYVSRRHAVVVTERDKTRIVDWGSKNGVYVNSKRVTEHFLRNDDIVMIGTAEFRYEERPKRDG